MDELPQYVPLRDRARDSIDSPASDEGAPGCEEAFIDPEKGENTPDRIDRIRQVIEKLFQLFRLVLQCLLPSFLLPKSGEPRKLHPTAWLGICTQANTQPHIDIDLITDGLRGIASLLVAIHHASLLGFSWTIHDGWAPNRHQTAWFVRLPIFRLLISGPPQVAIFFVVSGYAISHKALKFSHQGRFAEAGSSLFSSVFRRHPRLFSKCCTYQFIHGPSLTTVVPAGIVVFCTALVTWLDPTWFGTNGFPDVAVPTRTVPQAPNLVDQLRNWYNAEIQSTRPISNGFYEQADPHIRPNPYDPNLWTLPMEFSSSMVVFLFLMACTKLHDCVRMALALSLIIYLQYYFDFPALHMFLSGMLICDLHFEIDEIMANPDGRSGTSIVTALGCVWNTTAYRAIKQFRHSYIVGRVIGFSAFIFALWLLSTPELNYGVHESWGYGTLSSWVSAWYGDHLLSPYGAIFLVLTLDHAAFLQPIFTNRFSQYMGKISYSLYMIHGPLLWSVGLKLAHFSIDHVTGGDTNIKYTFGMFLAFGLWWPIAIYLSDLTVRYIDGNCVYFSKWVYEKLSKKDA